MHLPGGRCHQGVTAVPAGHPYGLIEATIRRDGVEPPAPVGL